MKPHFLNHALIMAAGRGNRMRPLTDLLPKPMAIYKGDTLIGNSLKMLWNSIPHVHVTVGYKKAMLSEYLMTRGGVDSILNTEGHGNAWWIQHTLMRYIDEPVLVLTTDNITELDIEFLEDEYSRLEYPSCMLVPVIPIDGIEGDYIDCDQYGTVFSIQRSRPKSIYCSGIQIINPRLLNHLLLQECENFHEVWGYLIKCRLLKASQIYPKQWFSIDTLEQLVKWNHAK